MKKVAKKNIQKKHEHKAFESSCGVNNSTKSFALLCSQSAKSSHQQQAKSLKLIL